MKDNNEDLLRIPALCSKDLLVKALADFVTENVQLCQLVTIIELRCLPLPNDIV